MPSYDYGELTSKNYKSTLSQNNPSSFCPGDNQSFLTSCWAKLLFKVRYVTLICTNYGLAYCIHCLKIQIPNNAGTDLVVDIMKLSFDLIVRYLFEESTLGSSQSESGPHCSLISKNIKKIKFHVPWCCALVAFCYLRHQDGIFSEAQQALNCDQLGICAELCEENMSWYRCLQLAYDGIMNIIVKFVCSCPGNFDHSI